MLRDINYMGAVSFLFGVDTIHFLSIEQLSHSFPSLRYQWPLATTVDVCPYYVHEHSSRKTCTVEENKTTQQC